MKKHLKICLWIILSCIYLIMLLKSQDADMFWMIANGREILDNDILRTNPTSIVQLSMINQQWLYCVLMAFVDKLGYVGHIGFVLIQDALLVFLASYWLNSKIHRKWVSVTVAFALMLSCGYMINIRPQVITMCLLIAHMIVMDKAQLNKKWYLATIPIIILEANLHGALVLYHGILVVPYLFKKCKINWLAWIHAATIIPLALINPYGFGMIQYTIDALNSVAFEYAKILELSPFSPFTFHSWVIILSIGLFTIGAWKHKLNFQLCWYTVIITLLSMHQIRHTSVIYLPLLVMCAAILKDFEVPTKTTVKVFQDKVIKFVLYAITATACIICVACVALPTKPHDIRLSDSSAVSYMLVQNIEDKDAKILSNFNNGGYLEYVGYNKVMLDQRPEIYVEKDVLKHWAVLVYGYDAVTNKVYSDEEMNALINTYEFDYIFAPKFYALNRLCQTYDNLYRVVGEDDYYILYEVIDYAKN